MSLPQRKFSGYESNSRATLESKHLRSANSGGARAITNHVTSVSDTILSGFFSDTINGSTREENAHKGDKHHVNSIGQEKMAQLIKKLAIDSAANDPFFNPSNALSVLDAIKGKLIKKGQGNFARIIELDENLFLESYARGMHVHAINHAANESIYQRSKKSQAKLVELRGRLDHLQTAKLQLELRMNGLREANSGGIVKINTLQKFKTWADKEIDSLNYEKITGEELLFIANALQEYAKGVAERIYDEEKNKNDKAIISEFLATKNSISAINKEKKELNSQIRELEKDEIIIRDREAITKKVNTPLPSFPVDTLKPGETYTLRTDKFEKCTIESLSAPKEINGTVYYSAIISWKVHEGMSVKSRPVLLKAPLLGFLDIRDLNCKPLDFLTGNTYANTSKRIILPKILSKVKTSITARPINYTPPKPPGIVSKIKSFFGKLFS